MRKMRSLICLTAICLLSCFVLPFYEIRALAYVTLEAEIPVSCLNITDDKAHTYKIKIESENNYSPAPKSDTLEVTEDGTGKFEIEISEPGTFVYRVYEQPGDDPEIEYDSSEYDVTVFVEDVSSDVLRYAVSATAAGTDEKPDKIEFRHKVLGDGGTPEPPAPVVSSEPPKEADSTGNPITGFINSIIIGNSISAHIFRSVFIISLLSVISIFLFKREKNEEEDKNEE